MLDLDGDGIETVGIFGATGTGSAILFDHDADGVRTGTGWIAADDGLLVRDINGNGTIDSGRELFGDNTLLANGSTATNGFTALAQHDTNADGQINSLDAVFTQLRVWRDANQDGVSQANELQTLTQAGIASVGVQGTAANTNLGNGNTQIAAEVFASGRHCKRRLQRRIRIKTVYRPYIYWSNSYDFRSETMKPQSFEQIAA